MGTGLIAAPAQEPRRPLYVLQLEEVLKVARSMLAEPDTCEIDWTARGRHAPDCRWQAFRDYGLEEAVEGCWR